MSRGTVDCARSSKLIMQRGSVRVKAHFRRVPFSSAQAERDELYAQFLRAVNEVFQKSSLKTLLLEKKLCVLEEVLEKKDLQLNEVLASSNIDPSALNAITMKIEVRLLTCLL